MDPIRTPSRTPPPGRLTLWVPVLLYCALIFALSSMSEQPGLPAGITDKIAHAMLYAGLGLLVGRALAGGFGRPMTPRAIVGVVVFAALYGWSDECHQLFVPLRTFDVRDIAADVTGGAIGSGLLWLWGILRRSRHAV